MTSYVVADQIGNELINLNVFLAGKWVGLKCLSKLVNESL